MYIIFKRSRTNVDYNSTYYVKNYWELVELDLTKLIISGVEIMGEIIKVFFFFIISTKSNLDIAYCCTSESVGGVPVQI